MEEWKELRNRIIESSRRNMKHMSRDEKDKAAEQIADDLMDCISDNFRSLTEIHQIVAGIRAGKNVQIAYADPDEDDAFDECIVRACW